MNRQELKRGAGNYNRRSHRDYGKRFMRYAGCGLQIVFALAAIGAFIGIMLNAWWHCFTFLAAVGFIILLKEGMSDDGK